MGEGRQKRGGWGKAEPVTRAGTRADIRSPDALDERMAAKTPFWPAALILPSHRGAPQRTRSRLDLAKGSMGAKATVEHGNSSPGPPDSVI